MSLYLSIDEGAYSNIAINIHKYGSFLRSGDFFTNTGGAFKAILLGNVLQIVTMKIFGNNYLGFRLPYFIFGFLNYILITIMVYKGTILFGASLKKAQFISLSIMLYLLLDFPFLMASRYVENSIIRMLGNTIFLYSMLVFQEKNKIKYFLCAFVSGFFLFFSYFSNVSGIVAMAILFIYYIFLRDFQKVKDIFVYGMVGILSSIVLAEIAFIVIWKQEAFTAMYKGIFLFSNRLLSIDEQTSLVEKIFKGLSEFFSANIFFYNPALLISTIVAVIACLFYGKKNYIDRKKEKYKLFINITPIFDKKSIYNFELFIDENKNKDVNFINNLESNIKNILENKYKNFLENTENLLMLSVYNYIKLEKIIEEIISKELNKVYIEKEIYNLYLTVELMQKNTKYNIFVFFKEKRKLNFLNDYDNNENNNLEIEMLENYYTFSSKIDDFKDTLNVEDNKIIIEEIFALNLNDFLKKKFKGIITEILKEKKHTTLNTVIFEILKNNKITDKISKLNISGKSEIDYILQYLRYVEFYNLKYDKALLNSEEHTINWNKKLEEKVLEVFILKLENIKDVRSIRKKIKENIKKKTSIDIGEGTYITNEILNGLEKITENDMLEYLDNIDNKELKKIYKRIRN